jgi:hypothetical protein
MMKKKIGKNFINTQAELVSHWRLNGIIGRHCYKSLWLTLFQNKAQETNLLIFWLDI